MDRIMIPRDDYRKDNVMPSPAWGFDDGGSIFIRCECGLCMSIDHQTDANGNVNPSIYHDENEGGCGWHVWVTLEEWPN